MGALACPLNSLPGLMDLVVVSPQATIPGRKARFVHVHAISSQPQKRSREWYRFRVSIVSLQSPGASVRSSTAYSIRIPGYYREPSNIHLCIPAIVFSSSGDSWLSSRIQWRYREAQGGHSMLIVGANLGKWGYLFCFWANVFFEGNTCF